MEGRSIEFAVPTPETTDNGFSEKRAARIIEGKKQDISQAKTRHSKSATFPAVGSNHAISHSRKERILLAYRQNSAKLMKLMQSIAELDGKNSRLEEGILEEVKERRALQEEFLNALLLEVKNQLDENAISKEAWDLIK